MRCKICAMILLAFLLGCKVKVIPDEAQIFVVQEIKLDHDKSFFWFKNEQQITHEGLSYFQITQNKCDLSIENANAYCQSPEQILDIKKDTVSILTRSEIVLLKKKIGYTLKSIPFAFNLYDLKKKPKKEDMYFLNTVCK